MRGCPFEHLAADPHVAVVEELDASARRRCGADEGDRGHL